MLTVIESLLSAEQLERCAELVGAAKFVDGQKTAGYRAKRVKRNEQLAPSETTAEVQTLVRNALKNSSMFRNVAFPKHIHPVLISKYDTKMTYGAHVDDAIMKSGRRADIAVTVFLSDPSTYEGGELFVGLGFGEVAVKLARGAAVVYNASTIHRVAPVTSGIRLAAVTWVESNVRDPQQRELLRDLREVRDHLHRLEPDGEFTDVGFKTYANLLRMWAET